LNYGKRQHAAQWPNLYLGFLQIIFKREGGAMVFLKQTSNATRQKKCKHWLGVCGGLVLLTFMALNAIAYMHVWTMTHFARGGKRTPKPEALPSLQKLKVLFAGVTLPRPMNRQTPTDFELPYENLSLANSQSVRLKAWRIRHPDSKGTVILFHSYGASKDSLLPAARQFHELNYETLLVDFYGSGGSPGNETSIGFHEADDVLAAFQFARRQSPPQPVMLYGVSMGAAAILAAVHRHKIEPDALILECPFDRLLSTVQNRFRAMSLPSFPSSQLMVFWGGFQQGYNGFKFNPADYMREVHCPVLLLHGERDPRVTLPQMNRLAQNMNASGRYKVFAGLEHQSYIAARPDEWRQCVMDFLMTIRRAHAESI
jgi:uncharacterized protein